MNDRPIFILGAHKSGTTLLRNLFSGHPDLFVIPFESHFFELTDRDVDYEYRKNRRKGLSVKQIEANFKGWIDLENRSVDPMGDTFVAGKLNVAKFNDMFSLSEGDSPRTMFENYVGAIHESLGLGILDDTKRVVEKSVENAEFAQELSEMYPEARFIHIVRNPYANFVSLRKYKSIGVGYPLLNRMAKTFRNSYHYLIENPKRIKNYKVVRYEDILTDTVRTMKELTAFLELPFENSLLVPDHLGENWSGNSTTGKEFKGVSSSNLDGWKTEIESIEINIVNRVSSDAMITYGYPSLDNRNGTLKKNVGESVVRYIFNRLFYFFI